jgi:hypothetical protein
MRVLLLTIAISSAIFVAGCRRETPYYEPMKLGAADGAGQYRN